MKVTQLAPLVLLSIAPIAPVAAFSSVSVPYTGPIIVPESNTHQEATTMETAPWRVVLDVGREALSTMPFDWARSGCRMPLVIPCDFSNKSVDPQADTVSFTGPNGAVIRPIEGGTVQIKKDKELQFTLSFPETLARRDVTIDAGTTIQCIGTMFTKTELDRLNQEFYEARDETWALGGELNEMSKLQGAPKKWNEENKRWEKRSLNINPLSWAQKRLQYMAAKTRQDKRNSQRPDPRMLSERGSFPGVETDVYVAKEGVIKSQSGAVVGRWGMEPMLKDRPVSYCT